MLTRLELKTTDYIYKITCRYGTVPFDWNPERVMLKDRQSWIVKYLSWTFYIISMVIKYLALLEIMKIRDINSFIPYGIMTGGYIAAGISKANLVLYKKEMISIISLVDLINSTWGKEH